MIPIIGTAIVITAALLQVVTAIPLDVNSADSIRNASSTLAYGLMSSYKNNATATPVTAIGTLPEPLYWWEAGAVWGGMVDYWAYTGDTSYMETTTQALLAQVGPYNDYMPPAYRSSLGNDDQAFWGIAVLSALEYQFPIPEGNSSTLWLDLAQAVWNTQAARWDTSHCGGGLRWQVYPENKGYDYKNSISNGGFLHMSARLARHTGNQTYVDWCEKIWDWMTMVHWIDKDYNVFDGSGIADNCTTVNHVVWSYNPSILLYGAATLYNYTNSAIWQERTTGLFSNIANTFFSPYPNATDIAYEWACEPHNNCNNDQFSFKAYLSRWLAQSAIVAPYIADSVHTLLNASANAAALACSGGDDGQTCGEKWYVGGYDGSSGMGQQLSALETVQAMLLIQGYTAVSQASGSAEPEAPSPGLVVESLPTALQLHGFRDEANSLDNAGLL